MSMQQMMEQERMNAMAQSTAGGVRKFPVGSMMTSLKNPEEKGLMKTINRWTYFEEFLAFWIEGKKHMGLAAITLALGIMLMPAYPLVSIIALFFSAKFYSTSQIQGWIARKFGKGRTVIVVN